MNQNWWMRSRAGLRVFGWCCVLVIGFSNVGHAQEKSPAETGSEGPAVIEGSAVIDGLVVVGAGGTEEYANTFLEWADDWLSVSKTAGLEFRKIGPTETDYDTLKQLLEEQEQTDSPRPLWLILIGHGTWDGKVANFNLSGKDVSAKTLSSWLRWAKRPICIVNTASSSGPFINRLSGKNRVIVTATKSGSEQNFARFGGYFVKAFRDANADLDHDDAVSVREAFIKATAELKRFYETESRIMTEHALLDDNGDERGSDASLIRARALPKDPLTLDGQLASRVTIATGAESIRLSDEAMAKRDDLEAQLRAIQRNGWSVEQVREKALPLLKELAKLYQQAESDSN
ncbi:MAG: hypothetical protein AAFV88_10055 [Planctomycetota bacterium]